MIKLPPLPDYPHLHKHPHWHWPAYDLAQTLTNTRPFAITHTPDNWIDPEPHLTRTTHQPSWRMCGHPTRYHHKDAHCVAAQGLHTPHPGVAYCKPHGGNRAPGRATGAWIMAHAFATKLGGDPWDALQDATAFANGKVHGIQAELADLLQEHTLGKLLEWEEDKNGKTHPHPILQLDILWHTRLTQAAKWAIDAGLGERLIAQLEADAGALASATQRALGTIDMPDAQREAVLAAIGRELRAIDQGNVIEGETT